MKRHAPSIWLGLLAAPLVVLGTQSIDYALVQVACATGNRTAMNAVSASSFCFSLLASYLAYLHWRRSPTRAEASYAARSARPSFLALMAMLVAALCALIQLMMWIPQWLLSPCH
jgi:hypothetical protein